MAFPSGTKPTHSISHVLQFLGLFIVHAPLLRKTIFSVFQRTLVWGDCLYILLLTMRDKYLPSGLAVLKTLNSRIVCPIHLTKFLWHKIQNLNFGQQIFFSMQVVLCSRNDSFFHQFNQICYLIFHVFYSKWNIGM